MIRNCTIQFKSSSFSALLGFAEFGPYSSGFLSADDHRYSQMTWRLFPKERPHISCRLCRDVVVPGPIYTWTRSKIRTLFLNSYYILLAQVAFSYYAFLHRLCPRSLYHNLYYGISGHPTSRRWTVEMRNDTDVCLLHTAFVLLHRFLFFCSVSWDYVNTDASSFCIEISDGVSLL